MHLLIKNCRVDGFEAYINQLSQHWNRKAWQMSINKKPDIINELLNI